MTATVTQRTAAMLLAAFCAAACAPADPIAVSNAWVRAPAPGLDVAAAYFDIVNHGHAPIELIGARSSTARAIEIHTHIQDGDLMQMRKLDTVALGRDATVSFAAGGQHLMLLGFGVVTSNRIPITLLFSDATQRTVMFEMRTASGATQP